MKKYIGIIFGIILIAVIITVVIVTKNKQNPVPEPLPIETLVFDTALTTKHISTPDMVWPPAVKLSAGVFSCNAQGTDTSETGKVELKTIAGTQYCVTTRSEGAAGSMYTTYTYTAEIKNRLATTSFTLRFVQCDNYDDPERTLCKTEREQFNSDIMANGIIMNSVNGIAPVITKSRSCYTYHQVATKTEPYAVDEYLDLIFENGQVNGTKQGNQNGPDMTNGYVGSISGTATGDMITSVFDYVIEGSNNREQEIYKKTETGLEKLRYPLIQGKGMLVPNTTKEFKAMTYSLIDCSLVK
jgi:hypothetical protein